MSSRSSGIPGAEAFGVPRAYSFLPRGVTFCDRDWVAVHEQCTDAMLERANRFFDAFIKPDLEGNNTNGIDDKCRRMFARLFDSACRAARGYRVVAYKRRASKNKGRGDAFTQVVDAAVKAGFFHPEHSESGGEHLSRLVPIGQYFSALGSGDPWLHDPPTIMRYVELCKRRRGKAKKRPPEHIPFDPTEQFPASIQEMLEVINRVNAKHAFTCKRYCISRRRPKEAGDPKPADEKYFLGIQQLRPVHFARFIDNWKCGGRLITPTDYGHQNLRKIERAHIRIDDRETDELDYSGMHPRLIYHLEALTFPDDPYYLDGLKVPNNKKVALRKLVKQVFLTAINAVGKTQAVQSCLNASCVDGKQGNDREEAFDLLDDLDAVGIKYGEREKFFRKLYTKLEEKHAPIAKYLSSDYGTTDLMPIEASIALDVMFYFASHGKPILGVHDSFIVLAEHKQELCDAMHFFYRNHYRIPDWADPVVKDRSGMIVIPSSAPHQLAA